MGTRRERLPNPNHAWAHDLIAYRDANPPHTCAMPPELIAKVNAEHRAHLTAEHDRLGAKIREEIGWRPVSAFGHGGPDPERTP